MSPARGPASSVVGLVASAGGIEALFEVLGRLPLELPAAVLVALHQEPDRRPEALRDVLARRSRLPVSVVADREVLGDRRVFVVPPGRHLIVTADRRASVFEAGKFPPNRPSADLLFGSMASALGPDAVAVVLSGTGHDGATGATAVHACGGVVVATDEATSEQFAMPRATIRRDHAIDHVVALDDVADCIAEAVARQVRRHGERTSISDVGES